MGDRHPPGRDRAHAAGGCGGDDDGTGADTAITTSAPVQTSTTTTAGGGQAAGGTSPGSSDGSIGAETVENVEVPAGATCTLEGTTVTGNVRVRRDATLHARDVRVDGDVQGDGDLRWESQRGRLVADRNAIGGNLQAESNRGGLAVTGNRIDGNLQCQSNSPAPTGRATGSRATRRSSALGSDRVSSNGYDPCMPCSFGLLPHQVGEARASTADARVDRC